MKRLDDLGRADQQCIRDLIVSFCKSCLPSGPPIPNLCTSVSSSPHNAKTNFSVALIRACVNTT